jgi:acetyl esterase/lipase
LYFQPEIVFAMKLSRLLLLGLIISACQKNVGGDNPTDPAAAKTMMNVAYGSDAAQKMDIYLPAGRTTASTKVMVMIHGGAWASGDKSDFDAYVDSLKRRMPEYAICNINYRLFNGTTNTFPAQENDVKAAVEFVYSKRSEYLISEKFVLLGASAGGHLALLQGYKYPSPVKPKAIVDFFGPTDMTDLYNNPASPMIPQSAVASIMGGTPATNATLYQQSSPITFVTAQSPPTIILHGGTDPLVSPNQSVMLDAKLQTMGVVHQYVFYPTEGHSWVGPNLVHSFNAVQAFLTANVN